MTGTALSPKSTPTQPLHVAIIMDGNGRWAKARGLPRIAGHKRGAEAVRVAVKAAAGLGVSYLTLFGFSSENWKRPDSEVRDLMGLLRLYLRKEVPELNANNVRLRIIGDRERLSEDVNDVISWAEKETEGNSGLTLVIALSYGGRQDIVRAARAVAEAAVAGKIDPARIGEDDISVRLYTHDIPDPDLLIRTSGEQRISNFLLWQCAYAELMFLDTLWPDFSRDDLARALEEFRGRDRRFGLVTG